MTPKEIAALTGRHPSNIYYRARRMSIQPPKVGRSREYDWRDTSRLVEAMYRNNNPALGMISAIIRAGLSLEDIAAQFGMAPECLLLQATGQEHMTPRVWEGLCAAFVAVRR